MAIRRLVATSLWAAFLGNKAHFFRFCVCQSCNRLVAGFFVPAWFALRAFYWEVVMSASNPDIWTIAVTWLSQHKSVIAGFAMSVSVALLRLRGDQQKTRLEKISEAVLCGLLTVTVYHGFRMFGLQHESAAIFIGGAVGCLGAQEVRELMQSVINPVISAIASKRGGKNGPY
ncbi:MAG: phage holin family protein [Plesiomonas shigelloides]